MAGKGIVVRWERQQRQNHWFDALYNACAAGRYAGAKLITEKKRKLPRPTRYRDVSDVDARKTSHQGRMAKSAVLI